MKHIMWVLWGVVFSCSAYGLFYIKHPSTLFKKRY